MEDKYLQLISKIYQEQDSDYLIKNFKGKNSSDFCERIKKTSDQKEENDSTTILLETYRKFVLKSLEDVLSLKKQVYESYSKMQEFKEEKKMEIDSVLLRNPVSPNLDSFKTYDSIYGRFSQTLIN